VFKKIYFLSLNGKKNIIKSILLTTFHQLTIMLPVVLFAFLVSDMLDRYVGNKTDKIPILPYLGASAALLTVIYLVYLASYKQNYIYSGNESSQLRTALAEKFRKLPLSFLGEKDLSDLTSALMDDVSTLEKSLVTHVNNLFGGILSSTVILGILFGYNWKMALSLSLCLPAAILIVSLSKFASTFTNKKIRSMKLVISDGVQEFLENIKIIQSSPKKEEYIRHLDKTIRRIAPWQVLYEFLVGTFISISYNLLRLGLGFVIITGAYLVTHDELTVVGFLFFIFVAVRIYDPLTTSLFKIAEFIFSLVSAERIRNIMHYPEQKGSKEVILNNFDIAYDHVTFAYNEESVVKDVSFVAKQGEITALVGPSGCGKSTLCKLACRFWDVTRGKITIDGNNINTIDPETFLENFSIVFQDVVLFNDSIYKNIQIGNKEATEEEIYEAARLARCDEFIQNLPQGYQTVIGENGKTLSGGERQRISIARAFLKQAPIILLDEATASLDPENETLIQEALGRLIQGKTVLIIAHRLRTVENCDKIVVLDKGKIVEIGNHGELMGNDSVYSHLVSLQRESMAWSVEPH
jgi:ATP-binding cassette, subfamily B, bacterial IrtB/YbtQ